MTAYLRPSSCTRLREHEGCFKDGALRAYSTLRKLHLAGLVFVDLLEFATCRGVRTDQHMDACTIQ